MLLSRIGLSSSILGNTLCRSRGSVKVCMGNTHSANDPPPASSGKSAPVPSPGQPAPATAMATPASKPIVAKPATHVKCCAETYPRQSVIKRLCTDGRVAWSIPCAEYDPIQYTAPNVACKPVWADKDYKNEGGTAEWNTLDGKVDRRSHMGVYEVVNGCPRNPVGRTGICGRGLLGRWGPNHAADPIVTRWKRTETGDIAKQNDMPVLQFIAIQRKDSGEWALPGGMVSPGEEVSLTLKREFSEETMNSLEVSDVQREAIRLQVEEMFTHGIEVYRGYVDDPRNTDNAWMETVAVNFHDESGQSVGQFKLHAGDDAVGVQWSDMHGGLSLYASHLNFIKEVAQIHKAFW